MKTEDWKYPENDDQYQEGVGTLVAVGEEDSQLNLDNGFSLWIGKVPDGVSVGEQVKYRLYGKGTGYTVRGIFLNGQKVRYETEAESKQSHLESTYGKDCHELIKRWDEGKLIHTIEMGGMGPGYEQCIQVLMMAYLRTLLCKYEPALEWDTSKFDRASLEKEPFLGGTLAYLQPSGAQAGAAWGLACALFREGPIAVYTDPKFKERGILVSKNFPTDDERILRHAAEKALFILEVSREGGVILPEDKDSTIALLKKVLGQ